MHSLANLVVCTNLSFLLPKFKEKKIENFLCFFYVKLLLNQIPQEPENAANLPNGFVGTLNGQGLPPVKVILKFMAENGRDN